MVENEVEQTPEILVAPVNRRLWVRSLVLGIVILVCGGVIGSVVTAVAIGHRQPPRTWRWDRLPEDIAKEMRGKYDLNQEQEQRLVTVFQEHREKLSGIRAEVQPRVEAEHEALRSAVEGILTPEQAAQWRTEFEQMRRPWHHREGKSPASGERK